MQLGFIVTNQVEKMPHGFQWSMIQFPNYRDNYIFIYFGMPLKMNDISVLFIFIFIQINISHKSKSHMHLQTTLYLFMQFQVVLTSCHGRQSHLQSQNGYFGHVLQMHGLEWTWFLVVKLKNLIVIFDWKFMTCWLWWTSCIIILFSNVNTTIRRLKHIFWWN